MWHCHLLGHEENDMMRPMILAVAPIAPSNLLATRAGAGASQRVVLTWRDASANETGFTVQRAISAAGPWVTIAALPAAAVTYTDTRVARRTTYYYRVIANNMVGYTQTYALILMPRSKSKSVYSHDAYCTPRSE